MSDKHGKRPWMIGESAPDMASWVTVRDAQGWSRAYCADRSVAEHIVACVNAPTVNVTLAAENARLRAALCEMLETFSAHPSKATRRGLRACTMARAALAVERKR